MSDCFPLNYQTLLEIDRAPNAGTPDWVRVAKGFSNLDENNNDQLDQTNYLDGEGYGSTDVIGAQLIIAMTGHRIYGDDAQDFVESIKTLVGCDRKTQARITAPDGTRKTGDCTIANITGPSGDANAKQDFGFEVHLNGKPTLEAKVAAGALTAVVAAGTVAGTTSFTATPGAGNTLAYKIGASTFGTQYERSYIAGYTDYTSGDNIPAVVDQYLLMLELDANGRVVNFAEQQLTAPDIG